MSVLPSTTDVVGPPRHVRVVPILLQKSFWGDERKFLEPLMRFTSGDVRGVAFIATKARKPMGPETIDTVRTAAAKISVEIDAMLGALPADADLDEIAGDLIAVLASKSDHAEFIVIFTQALAARQALTELGVKF
jgi:hypothetical protein